MMRDLPLRPAPQPPRTTHETLAALRAVRRIAAALAAREPVCAEDIETAERVLQPPVSWDDVLRRPCGDEGERRDPA